ncbi:MAG: 4Fe-4S dicluster domain-containing protein [Deltaproteobacteria bacterium]|nr:4Fe-4S dicluster domain-containing protein [Deltaproteobacteria bacterium]
MGDDRRRFLKVAGVTLLAVGGAPVLTTLAQDKSSGHGNATAGAKRFAMVIDLKRCEQEQGCTLCSEACHREHNVPDFGNPKDEVKWIWKETYEHAFPSEEYSYAPERVAGPMPVMCNHCDHPPCVRVCPTKATWKRDDGIVMMDWHRCIGCRYCMVACPYSSRSFNWRNPRPFIKQLNADFPTRTKGVVEKCTMCEERLSDGLAPACVAACKAKAMTFGNLADPNSEVRKLLRDGYALRRNPGLGTLPQIYYLV